MPQVYPCTVLENLPAQRTFELEPVLFHHAAGSEIANESARLYHLGSQVLEAQVTEECQHFRRVALTPVGLAEPVANLELLGVTKYAGVARTYKCAGTIFLLDGEGVFCAFVQGLGPARAVGFRQLVMVLRTNLA